MASRVLPSAGSNARNILAAVVLLTTRHLNIRPSPVRASSLGANNRSILALGVDGVLALDVLQGKASDRDITGGVTVEIATIVVLFDEDTVLLDL